MTICYLRVGNDPVEDATRCASLREAVLDFKVIADDLARFGQPIEASVHFAPSLAEVVEYPDRVLALGPRGGVCVSTT